MDRADGGAARNAAAAELGTSTNSLYKLMHDGRRKLRRGLEASGFTIDDVRTAWA